MTKLRDLPTEERLALINALCSNKTVEVLAPISKQWDRTDKLMADHEYRLKPTMDVIPWEHIKPEYVWVARDKSGQVFVFKHKPIIVNDWWGWDSGGLNPHAAPTDAILIKIGTVDWRESLQSRPEMC